MNDRLIVALDMNDLKKIQTLVDGLGVDMLTLHIQGGFQMLEAVVQAALMAADVKKAERPKLLGITVLTSFDEALFKDMFGDISRTLDEQVLFLAQLAQSAGLDGVVASPQETAMIGRGWGKAFLIV